MGDVTEMDGPIFCDSNELEPVEGVIQTEQLQSCFFNI